MTRAAILKYKMGGRDIVSAVKEEKLWKRVVGTIFTQPVTRLAKKV